MGTFHSLRPGSLLVLTLSSPRLGDLDTQWLTSVPSAKQPGVPGWQCTAEAAENQVYRGRSVLLCRVFLTVPSSRGRAFRRLDKATVFLKSITA